MQVVSQSKKHKNPIITLAGPPNSGKTTLYSYISGEKAKSVNYPGSTIECKESKFLKIYNFGGILIDSPGIISLVPNSPEEEIAVKYLIDHPKYGFPDVIIVTVDASQLSRHLFLAKQIIETGAKVIVALTMNDILKLKGLEICTEKLKVNLKCEVFKVDGRLGNGVTELMEYIKEINFEKRRDCEISILKSDKNSLIEIFNDIEYISSNVITKITDLDETNLSGLEKANSQLIIKNSPKHRNNLKPDERTLRIDKFLLHKYWGILIFLLIMAFTFSSIFWLAAPVMELIDSGFTKLSALVVDNLKEGWFRDMLSEGIISGTGAVMVFIPQILILFLILGFLEDTGYLARGAMLIDKPLSKVGLNGRSFVPMLSGFACAIPAIMATRTIQNKKERFLTIFIIPLISCSARLPVYTLLIAFLLPGKPFQSGLIMAIIYLTSSTISLAVAGIINKFQQKIIRVNDKTSFIMELPAYRVPKVKIISGNAFHNLNEYLKKAGPVIIIISIAIWFLTYFPDTHPIQDKQSLNTESAEQMIKSARLENSYASKIGILIEPIMKPLGMDWRIGVSLIATFTAREVFVSSLALIFKVTEGDDNLQKSILSAMRTAKIEGTDKNLFSTSTIIGLIVFFVFALQCMSTIAITKKETGGWRIPALQVLIYTSLAYVFTFITVNGLRIIGLQ